MTQVEQDTAGGYHHPDPVVDAALTWFVALQSGAPDPETLAAFDAWRRSDPRHAAAYDRVAGVAVQPELAAVTRAAAQPAATIPLPPVRTVRPAGSRVWWSSLAAAIVLAAIGLHLFPTLALRWSADYVTAAGERREVTLPDGSRLLLNTGTAVALDFADDRREVTLLQGEAFFDVVRDPIRPFRVVAGFSAVEVTGTAFAVRVGTAEDSVVLERGRVSVHSLDDPAGAVVLAPGDGVTATAQGLSAMAQGDASVALAWRDGRYVFHDQPLATVVDALRRYHGAPILVLDGRVERERVSGNYRTDDPVAVLRSLAEIAGVRMTVLPAGILILG